MSVVLAVSVITWKSPVDATIWIVKPAEEVSVLPGFEPNDSDSQCREVQRGNQARVCREHPIVSDLHMSMEHKHEPGLSTHNNSMDKYSEQFSKVLGWS